MEEAVYKELKALCHKIVESGNDLDPKAYLQDLRKLEEKLILLDYLKYRSRSFDSKPASAVTDLDNELMDTLMEAEKQRSEAPAIPSPVVEKIEEAEPEEFSEPEAIVPAKEVVPDIHFEETEPQKRSLNETLASNQISLGLNDRLAFTKHLFAGSQQDLQRVMSQLNTFDSYTQAESFINDMVKPDYDWSDQTDYEERLIQLVKSRFGED